MNFTRLLEDSQHFFDHLEVLPPPDSDKEKKYANSFIMSFDAEWYQDGARNIVLSYQIATSSRTKTNNIIEYMEYNKRLTLTEIVELGIKSVTPPESIPSLRNKKTVVVLISHNTVAEWSVLADRDEPHITKRLTVIRNSPITDGHPIKVVVADTFPVDFLIYDTMLLSPATHRGLKKLSGLLGDKDKEKETITQFYIEHMNLYLQDHPDKYRKYALRDTEVTLRLFFILQESLNALVGGDKFELFKLSNAPVEGFKFKLFRTLASAGVTGFLNENDWYEEYNKALRRSDEFFKPYQLAKRSYLGGRSEGYFVGRTANHEETRDKIWVDIDFSGCYPTSMAMCPKIDINGIIDYISYRHELTDQNVANLINAKVDLSLIHGARDALNISPDEFDKYLSEITSKKVAWKIRKEATVVDDRLIKKWYQTWQEAKATNDTTIEKVMIPGFARVRFKFPADTQFPCLPVRHEKYGLLYVLQGETTATATEIILAMEAGATIEPLTSVELPIERDENGEPVRFVLKHLTKLTTERNKYKADKEDTVSQVKEKLVKEFMNSFYGKFSQAINPKNAYKPSTGEMVELGKSALSEPITASLVTSLARAALSATLIGIERFNKSEGREDKKDQITVISATTDGLLIGLPSNNKLKEVKRYYKKKDGTPKMKEKADKLLNPILKKLGCQSVMDEINKFLSIKQMRNSRKEMTKSCEIFEIKHMADKIISVKTRGQIGLLNSGHTSLLARFGHKPPLSEIIPDPEEYKRIMEAGGVIRDTEDTKWIKNYLDRIDNGLEKIDTYTFITLTSFRKIFQSNGTKDLVKLTSKRKMNTDFDWKRKLTWVIGADNKPTNRIDPFTVPFSDVTEMLRHRNQMESIRRTGYIARPEKVLQRMKLQGRTIRYSGGDPVTVTRLFVRGVLNGEIPVAEGKETQPAKAAKINQIWEQTGLIKSSSKVWSKDDFKNNDKRAKWEPGCIPANSTLEDLVERLAEAFKADPTQAKDAIFGIDEFEVAHTKLIVQVISAVMNAPQMGIEPFVSLSKRYLLPDPHKIRDVFHQQLSDEEIDASIRRTFIPGQLPASDQKKLKRLFYSVSIPHKEAEECAKIVAPSLPHVIKKNMSEKKCTDHFLLAVLQADINVKGERIEGEKVKGLQSTLQKFGLTRNRYYQLKKSGNFRPNCISDTPSNRQQIRQMAKAIGRDPATYLDMLISK